MKKEPNADLTAYRDFYLEHVWERAVYYDELSKKVTGRPGTQTLLVRQNLVASLFLNDLLNMFEQKGWKLIGSGKASQALIFAPLPDTLPAGESIIWSLAKESKKIDGILRYPAEDSRYGKDRIFKLGW